MFLVLFTFITLLIYMFLTYVGGRPHPKFPPGPYRWPVWGGYLQLLLENYKFPHEAMHWMSRRYKTEVLGLYLGPYPTVVACTPNSVRDILNHPSMQGRISSVVSNMRDPDGVTRGQFFIDGDRWTEQRRFMLRNLRDFGFGTRSTQLEKIMEEEIRDFIDLVQTKNHEGFCSDGKVKVPPVFYAYFTNLALQVFLGTRIPPSQYQKLKKFVSDCYCFSRNLDPTTGAIGLTPWVRHFAPGFFGFTSLVKSNDCIKEFIHEVTNDHKGTFMSDALRDFCDTYLKEIKDKDNTDEKHWFSDEQMVMTIWDTLFAAVITQATTMCFIVEVLLEYPEIQAKAQQEVDDMVGRSRLPTLDDRKNLPYLEALMREVMRRKTLTPVVLPHRCTEDTYFYGYFIPKNTMVLANQWSNNMDEKLWDNPYEFRPERHLEEDGTIKKKDMVLAFGFGKHVCSGETFSRQNMMVMLATMVQNFNVKLPEGHSMPDEKNHLPGSIVNPHHFEVIMEPR
ncbi:hypothetical protein J6590_057236 [Homalodisca vitripennis]|nr:hypothetical protein J6590_057236 [Homalodisca vitripennis]